MEPYPQLNSEDPKDMAEVLRSIARQRGNDISDFNNLPGVFMKGRKVAKVPASSADVTTSDRLGDFNVTASYVYFLINNGGTPAWRRAAVGSW